MISISLLFSLLLAAPKTDTTPPAVTTPVNKVVLLQLVNAARKKGCDCGGNYYYPAPAVVWNDQLEKAAINHSNDMFAHTYFSHTAQDGRGAGERISDVGYTWKAYGENIAMGYANEAEVVEGWLKSPGHCKNIMNKDFREMGVARQGAYWTQDFGSK